MSSSARDFAQKYLEDLLSFFGLNMQVEADEEQDTVMLQVPSTHLNGFLIGAHGENLRSLQYLTNMALRSAGFESMAVVDIAGYRRQRNERLTARAKQVAEQVLSEGREQTLDPMSAFERRIIHQAVSEVEGVSSQS